MKVVLQNLTKTFPGRGRKVREEVVAVSNFDFEIPDGRLIGLLGPSGCGKSTTLNLISGLVRPTSGRIFFGEEDVTALAPEHRGIGLVFQNYALYPHLTVRQNITFPLENLKGKDKLSRQEMEEKALEAARLVQIEELMDRRPGELSGGQQQRVAIARALVKRPKVLLLDEPLSNLDARLRLQTREEIRRIQRETGITTIFVTHDQEEAMSISDLIVVMEAGVIQQTGRPQEVYDDPENLFVARFLGTPPINVFEAQQKGDGLYIGGNRVLSGTSMPEAKKAGAGSAPWADGSGNGVRAGKTGDTTQPDKAGDGTGTGSGTGDGITRDVYVGIRPEGFLLQAQGPLVCELDGVEVMGRDVTVVSTHQASRNTKIRSIVSAEGLEQAGLTASAGQAQGPGSPGQPKWHSQQGALVRFGLNPRKVFVFDRQTGERIRLNLADLAEHPAAGKAVGQAPDTAAQASAPTGREASI